MQLFFEVEIWRVSTASLYFDRLSAHEIDKAMLIHLNVNLVSITTNTATHK